MDTRYKKDLITEAFFQRDKRFNFKTVEKKHIFDGFWLPPAPLAIQDEIVESSTFWKSRIER